MLSKRQVKEAVFGRAAPAPEPKAPPSPAAGQARPRGIHLMANLRRISSLLRGIESDRSVHADDRGPIPTPEALAAAAQDLDLDVAHRQRDLRRLTAAEMPCVALMKSGTSVLILDRPTPHEFLCDTSGERELVAVEALAADHSGTIFVVEARRSDLKDEAAPESAKHTQPMGLVRRVFAMAFTHHRHLLTRLLLAAAISNMLMVSLPLFSMAVYDRVIPHLAMETLTALAIGVSIALCVDLAVRYVRLKLIDAIGLSTSTAIQASLFRHLLHAPMSLAPRTAGGLANQIRDIDQISQAVPQVVVSIAVDLPFFVLIMLLLALIGGAVVIAPLLGLLVLGGVYTLAHVRSKAASERSAELQRAQSNLVIEAVSSLERVKATTAEQRLLRHWELLADRSATATHAGRLWSGLGGQTSSMISQAIIVLVLLIGVHEIAAGAMTVGALSASTLLAGRALTPLAQFVALADRMAHILHAISLTERLLAMPMETAGDMRRTDPAAIRGEIAFHNVDFVHPGETAPALKGISLKIQPGERVGIIGRVGSGKSSLLKLMLRLNEPSAGTILVDGHDIRQFAPRALRQAFGFLAQDCTLFDMSLRANIGFGLDECPTEAFERAVAISGVRDFASRHPRGYDMPVGPRGERLSGGERQSVALARILIGEPKMLILDEPTASFDNTAEARLMRDLRPYLDGRTLVIATHRAAVLSLVDRVIWMDGGKILADGPREEVMARLGGQRPAA